MRKVLKKLIIHFDELDGISLQDVKIKDFINDFISQLNSFHTEEDFPIIKNIRVGSELIITGFRAAVATKKIKPEQIEIYVKDVLYKLQSDGKFIGTWPEFPHIMDEFLIDL